MLGFRPRMMTDTTVMCFILILRMNGLESSPVVEVPASLPEKVAAGTQKFDQTSVSE